jgi:hypothetical protein
MLGASMLIGITLPLFGDYSCWNSFEIFQTKIFLKPF